ncbi:hypothetical protein CRG98_038288 [Punica granatum]|uniref:Uncharacterized protein n=1 Tax=Punica granatum TaxID=22663 RepID=A0A2I0IBE7_PUNGR|nr:hypothetical protein CRG98_038288 [Punica granatum]
MELCRRFTIAPSQLPLNSWRCWFTFHVCYKLHGIVYFLNTFLHFFRLQENPRGLTQEYFFMPRYGWMRILHDYPSTNFNWRKKWLDVTGPSLIRNSDEDQRSSTIYHTCNTSPPTASNAPTTRSLCQREDFVGIHLPSQGQAVKEGLLGDASHGGNWYSLAGGDLLDFIYLPKDKRQKVDFLGIPRMEVVDTLMRKEIHVSSSLYTRVKAGQ